MSPSISLWSDCLTCTLSLLTVAASEGVWICYSLASRPWASCRYLVQMIPVHSFPFCKMDEPLQDVRISLLDLPLLVTGKTDSESVNLWSLFMWNHYSSIFKCRCQSDGMVHNYIICWIWCTSSLNIPDKLFFFFQEIWMSDLWVYHSFELVWIDLFQWICLWIF